MIRPSLKAEGVLSAIFYKLFGNPLSKQARWDVEPIGQVIEEPQFGISVSLSDKSQRLEGSIPVLRIANIAQGGYLDVSDLRYERVSDNTRQKLLLIPGDLLFNWRNSPNLVGKTAVFSEPGDYIFASFLFRLRVHPKKVENRYLWFFLNHLRRVGWFETNCRQAVSQANFGRDELCNIKIPLPPITLQREFAAYVDSLETIRKSAQQTDAVLHDLFSSLLHRAFSCELTAKWREAHMKELLAEMEQQSKLLSTAC